MEASKSLRPEEGTSRNDNRGNSVSEWPNLCGEEGMHDTYMYLQSQQPGCITIDRYQSLTYLSATFIPELLAINSSKSLTRCTLLRPVMGNPPPTAHSTHGVYCYYDIPFLQKALILLIWWRVRRWDGENSWHQSLSLPSSTESSTQSLYTPHASSMLSCNSSPPASMVHNNTQTIINFTGER